MNWEIVITGVFTLTGVMVGGVFSLLAARIGQRWKQAQKDIQHLCDQVQSYYKLEELYKARVSDLSGFPEKTVLQDMRDQVETFGLSRPTMTALQAQKKKKKWD